MKDFPKLMRGDLIIITGRVAPVEILEYDKVANIIMYAGPKGARGLLIKHKGKIYNVHRGTKTAIKSIKKVGNVILDTGRKRGNIARWKEYR